MPTQVGFYHLVLSPLEKVLPVLVGKALGAGLRVLVMTGSEERVAYIDDLLWTFEPESWIPHGTAKGGDGPMQPVYITAGEDNPNRANVLILTDGVYPAGLDGYDRCLNLFDGKDDTALAQARALWTALRQAGHELTYYQQTEHGGWQEKARAAGQTSVAT